ncbi:MAG: ROK family transcriptional regulator [Spirochaetaceae bacterium]|nr:MAG: ROK family transcriptional regulator [Spirochaetaceae bacterium]
MNGREQPGRYLFPRNVHSGTRHRIKDREKSHLFHIVSTNPPVTRKSIVNQMAIRPSTVSSVVAELIRDGLVTEGAPVSAGRKGRPESYLHPQFNRFSAVAVYAVSRRFHAVLVNLGQMVMAERSLELPGTAGQERILQELTNLVGGLRNDRAWQETEVLGIGLALPGNLIASQGRWLKSTRWEQVRDLDFREISPRTGLPVVSVKSLDAECEYVLRRYPDLSRGGTLVVHWGYGIGASYAERGKVLHPRAGTFGEVGHWCLDSHERLPCVCGDSGCLETRAALWALLPGIRRRFPDAPELEDEFSEFLRDRDPLDIPGLEEAIDYMAVALRNLYQLFYPDHLVLYGPFTENVSLFSTLSRRFHRQIERFSHHPATFRAYKMKSEGEVFGCTREFFLDRLRATLEARWG